MRRWIVFCIAALSLAGTASAQNTVSAAPAPSAPAASGANQSFNEDTKWLLGFGYVYQRFDIGGTSVNMNGVQGSFARFMNDYFAIEGVASATFGSVTPSIAQHLVFYGGGGRVQLRGHKLQPWAHALFGGSFARFTQGVGPATFNGIGIMAGGGVDYKFGSHIALRAQGDYLGTHLKGAWQTTASVGGGIALDF